MSAAELKRVVMYTDGAAEPNPGPGGWGVVLLYGSVRRELSGGFERTTNNRMELRAVIEGLKALKALCAVRVHCDSKYVVEAMVQGWARGWKEKEFLKKGRLMTNADLWKELLELCELHRVEFVWVKGHAGDVENERCDVLAMAALLEEDLPVDAGYEAEREYADAVTKHAATKHEEAKDTKTHEGGKGDLVEGGACRECGGMLERRVPKKRGKGAYYYEWYLFCPGCKRMFLVEEAKRWA